MRVAVLLEERCHPDRCNKECIAFCPPQRTGQEVIWIGESGKPVISEVTCIGCGICVQKCPFDALRIINLADELEEDLVHQFDRNAFRLFRLPVPKEGQVTGLLGPNGIGKTTTLRILSGEIVPNLGDYEGEATWDAVLDAYAGTELHDYLERVADGAVRSSIKPQYVDQIPRHYKGAVRTLLDRVDAAGRAEALVGRLGIAHTLDRDIATLSGGELQRVAIAATVLRDADVYFFDEPSSYLDIRERLRVAQVIRELSEGKQVLVIEHDLAVLDFLADNVHILYGTEGAYGILTQPRKVRVAVNTYLSGFLKEENVRFRDRAIAFEAHPPRKGWRQIPLIAYGTLEVRFETFALEVKGGTIHQGEVVGIVGPNATGKTTFVKVLAGVLEPDSGTLEATARVSYKPQYIESDFGGSVEELYRTELGEGWDSGYFRSEVLEPLGVVNLLEQAVDALSGGELQRVAVALCLGREADIYLLDEPSAYLDSNQRMEAARTLRRVMENRGTSGMIVDHDVYFIDLVADSLMVFGGEPAVRGVGEGPLSMRAGMNQFLRDADVTFRRDAETRRPRINKPDSRLDREQRAAGEFYYALA